MENTGCFNDEFTFSESNNPFQNKPAENEEGYQKLKNLKPNDGQYADKTRTSADFTYDDNTGEGVYCEVFRDSTH